MNHKPWATNNTCFRLWKRKWQVVMVCRWVVPRYVSGRKTLTHLLVCSIKTWDDCLAIALLLNNHAIIILYSYIHDQLILFCLKIITVKLISWRINWSCFHFDNTCEMSTKHITVSPALSILGQPNFVATWFKIPSFLILTSIMFFN